MNSPGPGNGTTANGSEVDATWLVKVALLFALAVTVALGLGVGLGVIPV